MKKIFLFLPLVFMIGCFASDHHNDIIQPELDSIITKYIELYPDENIYCLCFYQYNNKQFFNIRCSGTEYDSRFVDACFMKNNKIVVAYSINQSLMDSLLNISSLLQCFDSLKKYNDRNDDALMFYDKDCHTQNYRILKNNHFRKVNDSDYLGTDSAHSNNVIRSEAINRTLNQHLNNSSLDITYLRFDSINGENYLILGEDYVFSKKTFSGMFYRDGRIVVIYDMEKLVDKDIIDQTQLLPVTELKDYREVTRKRAKFIEKVFKIKSSGELIRINSFLCPNP